MLFAASSRNKKNIVLKKKFSLKNCIKTILLLLHPYFIYPTITVLVLRGQETVPGYS